MTTGIPRFLAAASLATVAEPPEFLLTITSIRCFFSRRSSSSRANGPRATMTVALGGRRSGGGGSTLRTM